MEGSSNSSRRGLAKSARPMAAFVVRHQKYIPQKNAAFFGELGNTHKLPQCYF